MPAQIPANGGQAQKPTKSAALYTGRFFQGLNTNRSPLRAGSLTALQEKFYGGMNDTLIGGLNSEISNRLTLCRRPGNPIYTNPTSGVASATFNKVARFESFHLLGPTTENIDVMIDTIGPVGPPAINPGFSSNLLSAANYAILAAAGITNTGATVVTGGVIGSFPTTTISFDGGTATVDNVHAAQAQTDALVAYNSLSARTFTSLGGTSVNLSTSGNGVNASTYLPGNYSAGSSMDIPTSITLDAQGNPNAVFIFKAGSTLTLESTASVILANGAQADNVVWLVGSSFTSVAPSTMVGNILANTSITLGGGGTLTGRALAGIVTSSGAVTISSANSITVLPINGNGGSNTGSYASLWTGLDATGVRGTFPGGSAKQLVFQKSVAQQMFMESVGNILFFGDGAEQRKWLETVTTWASIPSGVMSAGQFPFFTTYIVDSNFAIQQLIGTILNNSGNVTIASDGITVTLNFPSALAVTNSSLISGTPALPTSGSPVTFIDFVTASQLNGVLGYVTNIAGAVVTVTLTVAVAPQASTPDHGNMIIAFGGTPTKGTSEPTWATVSLVPAAVWPYPDNILTIDGTALWINRSNVTATNAAGVFNWGIKGPTGVLGTPQPNVGSGSWAAKTFYSLDSIVIAKTANGGDLWQVTAAGQGTSGAEPFTSGHAVGFTVIDGTVTWTLIQTAASLTWAAGSIYCPEHVDSSGNVIHGTGQYIVANAGGTPCVFQLQPSIQPVLIQQGTTPVTNMTTGDYVDLWFYDTSSFSNPGIFKPSPAVPTIGAYPDAAAAAKVNSLLFNVGSDPNEHPLVNFTLKQSGEVSGTTNPWAGANQRYSMVALFSVLITPEFMNATAGQCQLVIEHDDGMVIGCAQTGVAWTGPQNLQGQTTTAMNAYHSIGGINQNGHSSDSGILTFPAAGQYDFEIDYFQWENEQILTVSMNGYTPSPTIGPYNITSCATASGGTTVYNGTFPVGVQTAVGETFNVTGFSTNPRNNGYYKCTAQSPTQLTLANANGVAETAGAIATCKSVLSMATAPTWPAWGVGSAPGYPAVTEQSSYPGNGFGPWTPTGGYLVWNNHGPAADFVWKAGQNFTLPDSVIIDTNNNQEGPYRTGYTGTTPPAVWATALNALTLDNPNLIWINQGPQASSINSNGTSPLTVGTGWKYGIALVNSLDDTISNMSQLSATTGKFSNAQFIQLLPGFGLPPIAQIDPQADYVNIYRTTDGGAIPLLIPGIDNSGYTIPLNEYLKNGYKDTTPDSGLNALLQGAANGENTPPALGAINMVYHLNRIFYSIGNVVYWTTGPADPSGNGLNGTAPLNFDQMPSLVKRMFPSSIGLLVFTISDVYIISGQGTVTNPIQPGQPYLPGVGLLSYNALDNCGTIIGLLTTDGTQMMIDPGGGFLDSGQPIGNNFGLRSNNVLGQNWDPAEAYIAWYVNGEDQAWYVADGETGWYRLCATPAPESGYSWSLFAQISGGTNAAPTIQAVQAIEVQPGIKRLLVGPSGSGQILRRASLNSPSFTDGASAYRAFADIGSLVLVDPGQVAAVNFVTTESVLVGNPVTLGLLLDEAEPYTSVPFDILRNWVYDPPNRPRSRSLLAQRFYVSEDEDLDAICRNIQIRVDWGSDTVQNELLTYTVYGSYYAEN